MIDSPQNTFSKHLDNDESEYSLHKQPKHAMYTSIWHTLPHYKCTEFATPKVDHGNARQTPACVSRTQRLALICRPARERKRLCVRMGRGEVPVAGLRWVNNTADNDQIGDLRMVTSAASSD